MNVVLLEPEMPSNTGNIGRTCVATNTRLHLIEPLGFKLNEKALKRAGLDYWDKLDLTVYPNLDDFFAKNEGKGRFWYFSTKAARRHSDIAYADGDYLIFGRESAGLPETLVYGNPERAVRIPMRDSLRSLNLSNSVAIAVYEALRQMDYPSLR